MTKHEFVDNQNGNTLAAALRSQLEWLAENLREPVDVSIATGYFNPGGFVQLAHELESSGKVRLLLGAEPTPPPARRARHLDEPRGERFEQSLTREALELNDRGLRSDRDLLEFDPQVDRSIRKLLDFLASGRIEVRRYEKRFLHGKAYLFSNGQGVLAGSSNFTTAGLTSNLELNLGQYQPSVVGQVEDWFEKLWVDAVPYDLASIYAVRFIEYDPYLIFLRVLLERYGNELLEEAADTRGIQLTRFQTDGLARAKRILAKYNGVLIADAVGLGKTFIAGGLLAEVIERNRQRALLIAPAALRDGTWQAFRVRYHWLGLEVKSFEQVAQDRRLGGDGVGLDADPKEYSLIVIDEAHAFRSVDTRRANALRQLLRGDPPKKLVLMTATPVNNSLWDLYDLLGYFIGHDAAFADAGITSLKQRFEDAAGHDPFTLKPDVLFDVLDATTVRRTRHFVQRFYPGDRIEQRDGTKITIQFPKPHVESRSYDLEAVLPGFFREFAEILAPKDGEPKLTMARYWPSRYRTDGSEDAREAALVGLIRSGLLKRFESSAKAFANTTGRMVQAHEHMLRALSRGVVLAPDVLNRMTDAESHEEWEHLLDAGEKEPAEDIDTKKLTRDVEHDRGLLQRLHERAASITPEKDPKLALIVDELVAIARATEKKGLDEEDRRLHRKVLIFSYFADTVEWIMEYLVEKIATDRRLAVFRGRLAAVRGNEAYAGITRRQAVFGFAPKSMEAPSGSNEDLYDILVTTDVLAEGMNLQQASRLINYDLPWNPMRLVQRHGRIDRIGSPHADVFITCIFPSRELESLLLLEDRIRRKLAQAAASVGVDQMVIPGMDISDRNFADTLEEIEKLKKGDASLFETGGEDTNAHSGEEYRQELRKGLELYGSQLRALPGAAGSGLRRGKVRGHFFCARIDDRSFLRFVPFGGGQIIRDSLSCLRTVTCTEGTARVVPPDLEAGAYAAWAAARLDIYQEWQKGSDPANLQPDIRPLFKAAAAHVRRHVPGNMSIEDTDRVADALEAPWSVRTEKSLREVFKPDEADGVATTEKIVERVKLLGLQPWKAPEPLPPIDQDEVTLIVWMAVESE